MAAPLGSVTVPLREALVSCPKLRCVTAIRNTPRSASIRLCVKNLRPVCIASPVKFICSVQSKSTESRSPRVRTGVIEVPVHYGSANSRDSLHPGLGRFEERQEMIGFAKHHELVA